MKIRIHRLKVITKQNTEVVDFDADVFFIHGPVSSGKSSTARLVDYCLGGSLERTPAIRSEFVGAQLAATLGKFQVEFDRGTEEGSPVRVTWDNGSGDKGALSIPLDAGTFPILGDDVFNLSDFIFHLCEVEPVKVRKNKTDPDAPLVRLSFRDLMWYSFLQQDELDSSFFQMHYPFKAYKSRDVMRFVTGLYSERMNDLEGQLAELVQSQRVKRESVAKIREFMQQFNLGNESDFTELVGKVKADLEQARTQRDKIDKEHHAATHALEPLRVELRRSSKEQNAIDTAIEDLGYRIEQQKSLRSELITTKLKAARAKQAINVLGDVEFVACPRCNSPILPDRAQDADHCCLCGQVPSNEKEPDITSPSLGRDLDSRIDDLSESIDRHTRELVRLKKQRENTEQRKLTLDAKLNEELQRYDSAFTSSARAADSEVSRLEERLNSLEKQAQMPAAISALDKEAAGLQADIDQVRELLGDEKKRLVGADQNIAAIASAFKDVMLAVGFPGVYPDDKVHLDPRNWMPFVRHGDQEWSFTDAGSGGKKTLFNVCYALAVHRVALERGLPLPTLLIIDSPTKNITRDEDPELVSALYERIYALAQDYRGTLQLLLIDSHMIKPEEHSFEFSHHRMPPPLISYYTGP